MSYNPKGRRSQGGERLPEGIRRIHNRRLIVDFEARFPDGTAFRRNREFEPDELKAAINFVEKARKEFARGNGVGSASAPDVELTVAGWTEHCVDVAMPAQKNGRAPKYSDDALDAFRFLARQYIMPTIGQIRLEDLDKRTVTDFIGELPSEEAKSKVLNVLTRVMQLAESKGKRKKGTNPCKGVSLRSGQSDEVPGNWVPPRPADWRESEG